MEDVRAKKKKEAHNMFHERTKDDKIQLMNAFGKPSGKCNSTFRRITKKPKGKVFTQEATA